MQMIFYMLFQIFTFKDEHFAENLTSLPETMKLVGPRGAHALAFFNSMDPWHLVAPVVVRNIEGKSRAEALLNTAVGRYGPLCGLNSSS